MLFSERYAELIDTGNGQPVDNICGGVTDYAKERIVEIMRDFAEPAIIYPNRYDNYEVRTTALHIAVDKFNNAKGAPYISLRQNVFNDLIQDPLMSVFTPFLFDVIELQYAELSDGQKSDFQAEINSSFDQSDVPWLLCDGCMIKIDATQFELDLKRKSLALMCELKDSDPKFQAAYSELLSACDFLEKGEFASAISNAGKSYESVLKVICESQKGNADKLTTAYLIGRNDLLPATMTSTGFREKVMMSLPFIRNNSSADHGAGAIPVVIRKPLAELAINLAAAMNTYLIEEYINTLASTEQKAYNQPH